MLPYGVYCLGIFAEMLNLKGPRLEALLVALLPLVRNYPEAQLPCDFNTTLGVLTRDENIVYFYLHTHQLSPVGSINAREIPLQRQRTACLFHLRSF